MNAVVRRVYQMCVRVVNWTHAHPDDEPGTGVLVAQLGALAVRIGQVITEQRSGLIDVRAAAARKRELRRRLSVPISHLAQIGALAARKQHELGKAFRFRPAAESYDAFLSAARGMLTEAQTHKEVLVKHGLSEAVLLEFERQLDEFDAVIRLGLEGRLVHTAATRELKALSLEVRRIVRAMDARNRQRFQNDVTALEQWFSARAVLGTPRGTEGEAEGGAPGAGGEVKPAA
jgi:hypothetical protein